MDGMGLEATLLYTDNVLKTGAAMGEGMEVYDATCYA